MKKNLTRKMAKSLKRSTRKSSAAPDRMKSEMMRILLRGRSETLGEACKAVGITPTTFYYRLRTANFGSERRGRAPQTRSLTTAEQKRLMTLIRRQEKLQREFAALRARWA
ncbi:MAG: hypothetical protein IT285_07555 [Bdellovibrionales bacterium]|nr:hypothetical protein [Bdellovibrionales bacterium]